MDAEDWHEILADSFHVVAEEVTEPEQHGGYEVIVDGSQTVVRLEFNVYVVFSESEVEISDTVEILKGIVHYFLHCVVSIRHFGSVPRTGFTGIFLVFCPDAVEDPFVEGSGSGEIVGSDC